MKACLFTIVSSILIASCLGDYTNQTILTFQQYFTYNICYHKETSLNYLFARGIDIEAYKKYDKGYSDHSEVVPQEIEEDDILIGKKLGNGKFSDVYIGYNKKNNYEQVVVKILRPNKIEKIQREISILTKVNQIDNIARFYGVTVDKEFQVPSLVFEYQPGKTLKHQLQRLNEIDIRYYAYQLLKTISQSHKIGVLHRDIKSLNIIINHEKRSVKLIDWGLAEIYYPNLITYTKVGTICYKAPELLLNEQYYVHFTPAVDVWALGLIIIQMMVNQAPLFRCESTFVTLIDVMKVFGYEDVLKLSALTGHSINPKIYKEISKNKELTAKGKGLESLVTPSNKKYAPSQGLDLVSKLLKINPSERISAEEALEHPYFNGIKKIIEKNQQPQKKSKK